jgi:hypothetical protein
MASSSLATRVAGRLDAIEANLDAVAVLHGELGILLGAARETPAWRYGRRRRMLREARRLRAVTQDLLAGNDVLMTANAVDIAGRQR